MCPLQGPFCHSGRVTTSRAASEVRSIVPRWPPGNTVRGVPRRQIRPVRRAAAPADYFPRLRGIWCARHGPQDGRDASAAGCGQATAAMVGGNGDRQNLGLVRRHARHRKADDLSPLPADDEPACCARSAWSRIRLRPSRDETTRRAIAPDGRRRAGSRARPPRRRRATIRESQELIRPIMTPAAGRARCSASCDGLASGARR